MLQEETEMTDAKLVVVETRSNHHLVLMLEMKGIIQEVPLKIKEEMTDLLLETREMKEASSEVRILTSVNVVMMITTKVEITPEEGAATPTVTVRETIEADEWRLDVYF